MSSTPRADTVTLRIKSAKLRTEAQRYGLLGEVDIATHMGVHKATLYRLYEGKSPSAEFIAKALVAFPDLRFADLFDVVAAPEPAIA